MLKTQGKPNSKTIKSHVKQDDVEVLVKWLDGQHEKYITVSHLDTIHNVKAKLLFLSNIPDVEDKFDAFMNIPGIDNDTPENICCNDDQTFRDHIESCNFIFLQVKSFETGKWDGVCYKRDMFNNIASDCLVRALEMQISIYWDIENCCIPTGKDGNVILDRIITCICEGFYCVGNINVVIQYKNHKRVLQLRSNENVRFNFPVNEKQNISDKKIEELMLADSDNFQTFALISGDKDFTALLYKLRYMKRVPIILIHKRDADPELKIFPNVLFCYEDFVQDLPDLNVPELRSAKVSEISPEVEKYENIQQPNEIVKFNNIEKRITIYPQDQVANVLKQLFYLSNEDEGHYVIENISRNKIHTANETFLDVSGCHFCIKDVKERCVSSFKILSYCNQDMKMQLDYPRNPCKYKKLNVLFDMIPVPFPKSILGSDLTKWLLDFLLENEYKLNKFEAINYISKTEGLFSSLVMITSIHREDLRKKNSLAISFVRGCKESSKIVIITDDQELTEFFRTKENVEVLLKAELFKSIIPKDKQQICGNTDQVKVCTEELKTLDLQENLEWNFLSFEDGAEAECSNLIKAIQESGGAESVGSPPSKTVEDWNNHLESEQNPEGLSGSTGGASYPYVTNMDLNFHLKDDALRPTSPAIPNEDQ